MSRASACWSLDNAALAPSEPARQTQCQQALLEVLNGSIYTTSQLWHDAAKPPSILLMFSSNMPAREESEIET